MANKPLNLKVLERWVAGFQTRLKNDNEEKAGDAPKPMQRGSTPRGLQLELSDSANSFSKVHQDPDPPHDSRPSDASKWIV